MSRIASYKDDVESLKGQMFKFCLNPLPEVFDAIRNNTKVRDTDGYDLWERAVILTYAKIWEKLGCSYDLPKVSDSDYTTEVEKLVTRAKMQPRQIVLDKLLMIFCATGNVDYLQTAYEIGGDTSASEKLRGIALDSYTHIRNEFSDYVSDQDSDWLNNHKVAIVAKELGLENMIANAADAFAEIDRRIDDHVRKMERDTGVDEKTVGDFRKAAYEVTQKFAGNFILPISSEYAPVLTPDPATKLSFKKQKRLDKAAKKLARKEALKSEFSQIDREEAASDMSKAEQQFDELASKLK